jgi:hypothetical protein
MMMLSSHDHPSGRDTYLVSRLRAAKLSRPRVRVGAPDPSLTAVSGMAAVTELAALRAPARGQLGRDRDHTGGGAVGW